MLTATLAFLVIAAVTIAAAEVRRRLRGRGRQDTGLEAFLLVLAGAVLGNAGLGLLPAAPFSSLRPIVFLALAWIGLLVGLQIDYRVLARLQPWHQAVGFLLPAAVAIVITGAVIPVPGVGRAATALGAIAMVSAPEVMARLARHSPPSDRSAMRLLRLVISLCGPPAVLLFGIGATLTHAPLPLGNGPAAGLETLLLTGGLAILLGYTAIVLLRGAHGAIHITAMLAGAVALAAGAAGILGAEPMTMAMIAGAVIANRTTFPHRILRAAHSLDVAALSALLILLGAWWRPGPFAWTVFAILVLARSASLVVAGGVLTRVARRRGVPLTTSLLGLGLLPQGPLALVLLVAGIALGGISNAVAEAVFAALVFNSLVGLGWLARILFPRSAPAAGASP